MWEIKEQMKKALVVSHAMREQGNEAQSRTPNTSGTFLQSLPSQTEDKLKQLCTVAGTRVPTEEIRIHSSQRCSMMMTEPH